MHASNIKPLLISAILAWGMAASCTRGGDTSNAVPKPEGWPRIEIPQESYTINEINGVELAINSAANVETRENKDGGTWLDIIYPTFGNTRLYLTLLTVDGEKELADVIANRSERMELNSGGAVTELTELTSEGGWDGRLAVTRSSLTTPVQMLAHDGRHVVAGVLYLNFPPATQPDSVAPIVTAVRRDLLHILKHLRTP